jgi:hypothetical protein
VLPAPAAARAVGAAPPRRAKSGRPGPAALAAHGLTLAAAFTVWAYLDRNLWFFGDEWDFLTRRGLHGAYLSIWAPHNEHWSVLPILLWRAIYSLWHLSSYWPYLVPLLLAHTAVVHLVWRRCLRDGADIWLASAAALLFALLGTGAENLVWAFQIGFVSSVALGFWALDVAEGPWLSPSRWLTTPIRRDAAAAALGLAALMCSTVGLATMVALGVVVLARDGCRRTARVLVVPAVSFALWFVLAGRSGLRDTGDRITASVIAKTPHFVATNLGQALGHTAGWGTGSDVLALMLAAWLLWRVPALLRERPAVAGGALAAVVFYALAALGRDRISATLSPSRYAYVGAALLLPAVVASLSDAVSWLAPAANPSAGRGSCGRWGISRLLRPVLVLAVVAATASNMAAGVRFARSRTAYVRGLENEIVTAGALLQSPSQFALAIDRYPVWASGFAAGYLTPAVLATLYRQGLLPRARPALMTTGELLNDESWLDLDGKGGRLFAGHFELVGSAGLGVRQLTSGPTRSASGGAQAPPSAVPGPLWPAGPSRCYQAQPQGRYQQRSFPTTLRFALAGGARSGSLWLSLGADGGLVLISVAEPWGLAGLPGAAAAEGEQVRVPAGGHLWLNDSRPRDDLVVQLGGRQRAEVCGLAPARP